MSAPASAGTVRVIDGDTIQTGGVTYRLIGYDTPEIMFARCPSELARGLEAKDLLAAWLEAEPWKLEPTGKIDRWRRELAKLYISGEDVAYLMIRKGLGVAYHGRGRRRDWCKVETGHG